MTQKILSYTMSIVIYLYLCNQKATQHITEIWLQTDYFSVTHASALHGHPLEHHQIAGTITKV